MISDKFQKNGLEDFSFSAKKFLELLKKLCFRIDSRWDA